MLDGEKEPNTRPHYDRREVMQCHGLRKFFSTTCTLQGLPPLTVELLMGHKALGITGVYFKPTPNDLLEGNDKMLGYANVMKFLTISDENRLRLEVEKLSLKNKGNEQVINATLQEKDEQIKSLSEQFKTIQSKMQEMISHSIHWTKEVKTNWQESWSSIDYTLRKIVDLDINLCSWLERECSRS